VRSLFKDALYGVLMKHLAYLFFVSALAMATHAQTVTALHSFYGTDGGNPVAGIVQGLDGNFYGTTSAFGPGGYGTVFKMSRNGIVTTLYSFDGVDGRYPHGALILATNGSFYGTTSAGGTYGFGTIFKITPSGILKTLHNFDNADGSDPDAGLVQAADGNFYGTTSSGGTDGYGTVFKVTSNGVLTTLHNFIYITDGAVPMGGLVQGTNGEFYGTTFEGGTYQSGTVYKITAAGKFTVLHNFNELGNGDDSYSPLAGLTHATNGNLYGSTYHGADTYNFGGTVFKITLGGSFTTLYNFDGAGGDGENPDASLSQATDGNLYGTTQYGGAYGGGLLFAMTPGGTLTNLYSFCQGSCLDGADPWGQLAQGTNGIIFGTTEFGGSGNTCNAGCGTIFSLSMGLSPFVAFVHDVGKVGQTGGILGQNFAGTTNVSLNGLPMPFTVVSDTFIRATVPVGAKTGYVTVTTPTGTLTSNVPFYVLP
jgi:uncharacterized repeat protein (TIGR03803 family)